MIEENFNISAPELLVPAGDFNCLKAGVQNGADAIYFGSNCFSARANAKNFSEEELKNAIEYCKIRNVRTNLTINTLVTDIEIDKAIELAKKAYEFGIDAIIVQDLGLAKYLISNFPNLEVHASTQMSVHNLEGVLELEKLGFNRVVLARELPINEIEYIRKNSSIELELFVHGALCFSYSGQCLFSSLVGGRSGNRGKCAQPCRLPYELLESDSLKRISVIDKGYLLSSRDLYSLEYLPRLIQAGINSFKIEGRMKNPEYVAVVTKIYRKYIDMIINDNEYIIDENDKKQLLQVFNRGECSFGHLDTEPNKNLIYSEKPNNIGLYLGNISNYNSNKGYITLKNEEPLGIGDCICIDGETGKYTISELMINEKNVKTASVHSIIKIGRMKGNIKIGSKVFKVSSKILSDEVKATYSDIANLKRIPIKCHIKILKNKPICVKLTVIDKLPFYDNITVNYKSEKTPEFSEKLKISEERIIKQFSKLGNTPYYLENIEVDLDDSLNMLNISYLNDIRRTVINLLSKEVLKSFKLKRNKIDLPKINFNKLDTKIENQKISLLLENLDPCFDYSKLENVDNIYIPLRFFYNKKYSLIIEYLANRFKMFIYMPTIIKANYKNLLLNRLDEIVDKYRIKGFVISNIAGIIFLNNYLNKPKEYCFIANFTMNIFNCATINELKNLGINIITPSVELDKKSLQKLIEFSNTPVEVIAYGRTVLMNASYCLLGNTNKCYPECKMKCSNNNLYYLKDRKGYKFRILPDKMQTVTAIYNSKITSIDISDFNVDFFRINILDENIAEINKIINIVKCRKRLEGEMYTNGNLNKNIVLL